MKDVELNRQGYLGRTVDGEAVYVQITLKREDRTRETVEHEQISNPLDLAISGHTFDKGSQRWDIDSGGQIVDTLTRMDPRRLADGWTSEDVTALHELWQRWHLNTMRGACAHQEVVYEDEAKRRPSLDLTPPCPHTGYRYGHAWLTDPLPDEAVELAHRLAGMLDGTNGLRQR